MARSICFANFDNYPVLNPEKGNEYFGGESVQQTLLAKAFTKRGYSVSTVVKDYGQPNGETIDGIQVWKTYRQDAGIPVFRFLYPRLASVWNALKKADADVYYQSCAGMLTGVVAHFCRRYNRKFIFRIAHDSDCIPGEQIITYARDKKIYEYGLRNADFIASQSVQQQRLLQENYGLDSDVINMAVELPVNREVQERDIDILWVNNIRKFKRPELAVELAKLLPGLSMVMIGGSVPGNDELFREIKSKAASLANLEYTGAVPYHEVNNYFNRARVFVNTSDSEGFPNSFLQAWIRGVPVFSFFDPDNLLMRESLGGSPRDLDEMAAVLGPLLKNGDELDALSGRVMNFAYDHFSPDVVACRYIDVLEWL